MARGPGRPGIGDHARGRPFLSRLSERRRVRRRGGAGSASAFCLALAQAMQAAGHVPGMYIHASNSLSCPPTAGSVGGVFGSGGSAGDGVCTLGGQASARGCAARPACASGSTTFISPGIPSNLRSEASGRLSAGELTPRCTKKGKIAAACAIASGGFVLKRNLGIVAPEAAGAREAASS